MSDQDLMRGSTVLVTGGTGGIGLATATGLAGLGARVGIVGRSAPRGMAAADAVRHRVKSARVDVFEADLSAQVGVRRLAAEVKATYSRLDVLVNNVGGYWAHRHVTADGLERTFARQQAYNQSKLANVLFTYELARRLDGTGVTANVLHPGVVRTSFGREDSGRWMRLMLPLVRPFMKTADQGAATPIHLASSAEVAGQSGAYFASQRAKQSSTASYDRDLARRLWDVSNNLVGIEQDSKPSLGTKDQA